MIFAIGRIKQLSPPDVHALVICCMIDVFKYSADQAGTFSTQLIQHSSSRDPRDTYKAIIHRGIDGHRQWQAGQLAQLKENIAGIFNALGAAAPEAPA